MTAPTWQPGDAVYRVANDGTLVRGRVESCRDRVVTFVIESVTELYMGIDPLTPSAGDRQSWPDDYVFATELEAWVNFRSSTVAPQLVMARTQYRCMQNLDAASYVRVQALIAGAGASAVHTEEALP